MRRGIAMEYTVQKLAQLAGVSTRTLRYYDQIGLLSPKRVSSSGYRIYGKTEVDMLQQILFYRELGVALEEIKVLLAHKPADQLAIFETHLHALQAKKQQLNILIENVEKSMKALKGEYIMSDKEKFKGFKEKLIQENETKYGAEVREKYGNATVDASNAKILGLSEDAYQKLETLRVHINEGLAEAIKTGDPAGKLAQKVCALHREWLCYYWNEYSKAAHLGLGQMYVSDDRFKKYYDDAAGVGAAEFLYAALKVYCQ